MSKLVIDAKELIITCNGTDYPFKPLKSSIVRPGQSTLFQNSFTSTSEVAAYLRKDSDNAPDEFAATVLTYNAGNTNLFDFFNQININEEFYLWRRSTGRSSCLVFKKGNGQFTMYSRLYGVDTQLWSSTLAEQGTIYSCTDIPTPCIKLSFGYDDETGRFIAFMQNIYGQVKSSTADISYYWYISRWNVNMSVILNVLLTGNMPEPPSSDDPYAPGGHSMSGLGGDGDFDDTSDVIDEPTIPSISVSNSGLIKIYNPTLTEMNSLASYLITPNIFTALAQNVINLSDVIVGLCIVPFAVPDGGAEEVKLSVLGVQLTTGVQMHKAAQQFVDIDCGSYTLEEFWGNCMDYSPYTKVSIYLPYCGFYQLNADEVMGRTISVKYRCDIASGSCIAFVKVNGSVLYQFTGQCASQIPISNQTYDGLMSSMINLGASLLDLGVEAGSAGVSAVEGALSPQSFRGKETKYVERSANNLADAALNAVAAMKPNYHHTGCLSSAPGFMAVQKPFLIIERPRQSIPENYGQFNGYPSNVYASIGDLSGYIEVEKIQLNIPDATVEEILECETLLMKGVIV